jgi:hypothetical protein
MPHSGEKALTSAVALIEKREEIKKMDEKFEEEKIVTFIIFGISQTYSVLNFYDKKRFFLKEWNLFLRLKSILRKENFILKSL